ncbi:hypothetical protein, partial [Bacillus pumilus]|uniref:hypothetical protein n=1 Tax=Bacillus pumilus TaxID=1408 RepID=UPI00119D0DBF
MGGLLSIGLFCWWLLVVNVGRDRMNGDFWILIFLVDDVFLLMCGKGDGWLRLMDIVKGVLDDMLVLLK